MISIIIILLLAWAYYVGYSRGLFLQLFYTFGLVTAVLLAGGGYKSLASKISIWVPFANAGADSKIQFFSRSVIFELDKTFYAGVAFLAILVGVYLLFRFVGIFLGFLAQVKNPVNEKPVVAGILALLVTYFILETGLTILAMMPINAIQNHLHGSLLARFMVHTPIFSQYLVHTFFENVIHLNPFK